MILTSLIAGIGSVPGAVATGSVIACDTSSRFLTSIVDPVATAPGTDPIQGSIPNFFEQSLSRSLCYMDVIAMSVEQEIANVSPWSFAPGPWAEELNRITVRLRPAAIKLQRFVESPSQVASTFIS